MVDVKSMIREREARVISAGFNDEISYNKLKKVVSLANQCAGLETVNPRDFDSISEIDGNALYDRMSTIMLKKTWESNPVSPNEIALAKMPNKDIIKGSLDGIESYVPGVKVAEALGKIYAHANMNSTLNRCSFNKFTPFTDATLDDSIDKNQSRILNSGIAAFDELKNSNVKTPKIGIRKLVYQGASSLLGQKFGVCTNFLPNVELSELDSVDKIIDAYNKRDIFEHVNNKSYTSSLDCFFNAYTSMIKASPELHKSDAKKMSILTLHNIYREIMKASNSQLILAGLEGLISTINSRFSDEKLINSHLMNYSRNLLGITKTLNDNGASLKQDVLHAHVKALYENFLSIPKVRALIHNYFS